MAVVYVPYPIVVVFARGLAGSALAQRLFFARHIRSIKDVYEDGCGIPLGAAAIQRLLMAKTLILLLRFKIPKFSDRQLARYVRIDGLDRVRQINGSGQCLVLASAHYVGASWTSAVLARLGFDFRAIRRSRGKLHPSYSQVPYIFVGGDNAISGLREISGILKAGGTIFVPLDGLQGRGTVARQFFGRTCHFRRALIELAWTEGAAIAPVSVRFDLDGSIAIEVHEPFPVVSSEIPMKAAAADIIGCYAEFLEATIRAYPWCFDPARLDLFWRRTGGDDAVVENVASTS